MFQLKIENLINLQSCYKHILKGKFRDIVWDYIATLKNTQPLLHMSSRHLQDCLSGFLYSAFFSKNFPITQAHLKVFSLSDVLKISETKLNRKYHIWSKSKSIFPWRCFCVQRSFQETNLTTGRVWQLKRAEKRIKHRNSIWMTSTLRLHASVHFSDSLKNKNKSAALSSSQIWVSDQDLASAETKFKKSAQDQRHPNEDTV